MIAIRKTIILLIALMGLQAQAQTSTIRFPKEELPSEVVTPIVDSPRAVESALVTFKSRNELQLQAGSQLDEAFYSGFLLGLRYNRHFSEKYFMGLGLDYKMGGTSNNANTLSQVQNEQLDFNRAPQLKHRIALAGGYRFIYGKISFSKETIRPISIYAQADVGMGHYEVKYHPYVIGSINSQLFFSPNDAFLLTLGVGYREQPNVLSKDLSAYLPAPDKSTYDAIWAVTTELKLAYSRFF